jgi:hypothetical protein
MVWSRKAGVHPPKSQLVPVYRLRRLVPWECQWPGPWYPELVLEQRLEIHFDVQMASASPVLDPRSLQRGASMCLYGRNALGGSREDVLFGESRHHWGARWEREACVEGASRLRWFKACGTPSTMELSQQGRWSRRFVKVHPGTYGSCQ